MIDGNGRNPGIEDILRVAQNIQMDEKKAKSIAENIKEIVENEFQEYIL